MMLQNGLIHLTMTKMIKKPLPIGMNKKVYSFLKDELRGKIMKEFVALRAKTYAYLTNDDGEEKKSKGTKKCVIKRERL